MEPVQPNMPKSSDDHGDTSSTASSTHRNASIIVMLCLAIVFAAGAALLVHNMNVSHLTHARHMCAAASDKLRIAMNTYTYLHDSEASKAYHLGTYDVQDPNVLVQFAKEYEEKAPEITGCNADSVEELQRRTGRIMENTGWYTTHHDRLKELTELVNESRRDTVSGTQ